MNFVRIFLIFSFLIAQSLKAYDAPSDSNATANVRKVLEFLGSIADRDQVLSGQFRYDEHKTGNCVGIHNKTGKWPAVIEHYFYCEGTDNSVSSNEKRRQRMLDYWNAGGLISIWAKLIVRHSNVKSASGTWSDVWKEGTPKNNALVEHFETYYLPHMKWLQEKGVVLVFKPYNEELEYFPDIGNTNMKKLWQWTFKYFTEKHGLHNLIWFCAANGGGSGFYDRYPGDEYVDMVGFSDYLTDKTSTSSRIASYDKMISNFPNKIFAVAEEGWGGSTEPGANVHDSREIIALIKNYMPKTAYWVSWSGGWSPAMQNYCADLYNDPWVVDRSGTEWRLESKAETSRLENASPQDYSLRNFPNPFNPNTTIEYTTLRPGPVRLDILNALGQTVKVLVDGYNEAGAHRIQWNTMQSKPAATSGIYICRLKSADGFKLFKMTLLR